MTQQERDAAIKTVSSLIPRCERMMPKFAPGTSQHTLLRDRIRALQIAGELLSGGTADRSEEALAAALEPLASIARKCEKARSKHQPGSGQYARYGGMIHAMGASRSVIENELHRRAL